MIISAVLDVCVIAITVVYALMLPAILLVPKA